MKNIILFLIASMMFISCTPAQQSLNTSTTHITEPTITVQEKTIQEQKTADQQTGDSNQPTTISTSTSADSQTATAEEQTVHEEPTTQTIAPSILPPTITAAPASSSLDPRIQSILAKQSKIKNLQFMYVPPTEVTEGNMYYYHAPYWKIIMKRPYEVRNWENYVDTIYLDDVEKTAVGYCIRQKLCLNKTFTLDYATYRVKTPMEWTTAVTPDATWIGTQQYDQRSTIHVSINDDQTKILLDETYGIPLLIEYDKGENAPKEHHAFKSISANGVKEADVKMPAQ